MNLHTLIHTLIHSLFKNYKYYFGIFTILIVSSLHVVFFENNEKYDVYLFYNHSRFLTNILYDFGKIYSANVLTYFLSKYNKSVFLPVFYTTLVMWFTYFLFYNQFASLIIIPFYLCIAIGLQLKRKK